MAEERLDKLLAAQGLGSRKEIKALVRSGAVKVDGVVIKSADLKLSAASVVEVGGKPVVLKKHIYLMLNKPMGVVSAARDASDTTVVDLVPTELRRNGLFPAGRLDKDTTGFVLITDDGDFAHRILSLAGISPKPDIAQLSGDITAAMITAFAGGIPLKNEDRCLPAELTPLAPRRAQVVLREGMYHQIKRMFAACGVQVLSLQRIAMGNLALDPSLAPGSCRELSEQELALVTCQRELDEKMQEEHI